MLNLLPKNIYKSYKTELIYRGSDDGFKASDFHKKCDDKGTTLFIIKS